MSEDIIRVLKQQKKEIGSSPWVFPLPTDSLILPDSVLHILHRVLKRAGLPRVRFHDLRHTFAMLALQNGVDIKTVSGMLGHFSAGFTLDTYAHVTTAAQKEAARTMEKGYELPSVSPSVAVQCFPGLLRPEIAQIPEVFFSPLRPRFSYSGSRSGSHRNASCLNVVKNRSQHPRGTTAPTQSPG